MKLQQQPNQHQFPNLKTERISMESEMTCNLDVVLPICFSIAYFPHTITTHDYIRSILLEMLKYIHHLCETE